MSLDRNYKLESKTMDIYKDLKFESCFRSIDMAVQLHMILRLDSSLKKLKEMGKDKEYALVTSEFIYNNLNERGASARRTRRVLEFCEAIEMEYTNFKMSDPDSREELIKTFNLR